MREIVKSSPGLLSLRVTLETRSTTLGPVTVIASNIAGTLDVYYQIVDIGNVTTNISHTSHNIKAIAMPNNLPLIKQGVSN